ncbi:unnamed protein product [Paramecium sonneborni]|uniref:Uncharacterized protein n=1 Tax=Paramecium sonneborni TaxID=65129 RepID=A0A8S1MQP8_9CILI|nr:unnamed protein product [Paramecium sonneborni]
MEKNRQQQKRDNDIFQTLMSQAFSFKDGKSIIMKIYVYGNIFAKIEQFIDRIQQLDGEWYHQQECLKKVGKWVVLDEEFYLKKQVISQVEMADHIVSQMSVRLRLKVIRELELFCEQLKIYICF